MTPAFCLKPIAFHLGAVDGCLGPSATLRKLVAAGALAVQRDFPGDWPLTVGHPGGVASIERHEGRNFCNMGMVRILQITHYSMFFVYIYIYIHEDIYIYIIIFNIYIHGIYEHIYIYIYTYYV